MILSLIGEAIGLLLSVLYLSAAVVTLFQAANPDDPNSWHMEINGLLWLVVFYLHRLLLAVATVAVVTTTGAMT